ncbi:MAG: type II toxin-antitoxin system VapC family toxin [Gemmatimonadota bacterium]|nr:type II toxin-antitoxin system VapC family toxin [Gemmatimonadota bacterium]
MTLVVDATVVTSALIDGGPEGVWAAEQLAAGPLAAPHHMPAEVAGVLRRAVLHGELSQGVAALALQDLADLRIELFPFAPFARRVWELRDNVGSYDAWYVALAESLDVPLATLDGRLSRAPGCGCDFRSHE